MLPKDRENMLPVAGLVRRWRIFKREISIRVSIRVAISRSRSVRFVCSHNEQRAAGAHAGN